MTTEKPRILENHLFWHCPHADYPYPRPGDGFPVSKTRYPGEPWHYQPWPIEQVKERLAQTYAPMIAGAMLHSLQYEGLVIDITRRPQEEEA